MRDKIQAEASQVIINNSWKNTIIVVAPRVGKTKIVIDALKKDHIYTSQVLIVAPYKTIIESWKQEFSIWGLNFKGTLTTNASLSKCDPNKYKYVIVDEIQELSPNNIKDLKSYKNVIGLTGTLSTDNRQRLQRELKMIVRYEYTIEQAITEAVTKKVFCIGGVSIWYHAMALADEAWITVVNRDYPITPQVTRLAQELLRLSDRWSDFYLKERKKSETASLEAPSFEFFHWVKRNN